MTGTSITAIERRYLDTEAAGVYLGMSVDAIYTGVARRQIPVRRRGRTLVFDVVELDAYVHGLEGVAVDEAIGRRLHDGTVKELAK